MNTALGYLIVALLLGTGPCVSILTQTPPVYVG
jgi:hypothetical protein